MENVTLLADTPISKPEEDRLGRAGFARALGRVLIAPSTPEPLVVGLYGEWGLGKTSAINLAVAAASELDPSAIIVRFNPWYFSDRENLVRQFFSELRLVFEANGQDERYARAADLTSMLAGALDNLDVIPGLREVGKVGSFFAKRREKKLRELAARATELGTIKAEISALLNDAARRVIIIIDDIDRLTPEEMRVVFQVLKALADFTYVTYLVAFDDRVVKHALSDGRLDGEKYLEKIVTAPINLPPIPPGSLMRLTVEFLNEVATEYNEMIWNDRKRAEPLLAFLLKYCKTMRQLARLRNAINTSAQAIAKEANGLDLVGVCLLQVFRPDIYEFIRDNRDLVIDTDLGYALKERFDAQAKDRIEHLLNSDPHGETARDLLFSLIPRSLRVLRKQDFGVEDRATWRRERRLSDKDSFDTYFQLDVPANDVSRVDLEYALNHLYDEAWLYNYILGLQDSSIERALAFLERLKDYTQDPRLLSQAGILVKVLFDVGDHFPEDIQGFPFSLDGGTLIMQLVYQTLKGIPREQTRYDHLAGAANHAKRSLGPLVTTISVEDGSHGRYGLGSTRKPNPDQQLVTDDNLDILENVARRRIEEWAQGEGGGKLAAHQRLLFILYRWAEWSDQPTVEHYILERLNPNDFCRLAAQLSMSGEPFKKPTLERDSVKALADPAKIMTRLREIRYGSAQAIVDEETLRRVDELLQG